MAFATKANKIFNSVGYIRNQELTNFYNVMCIKFSSIFGFRFATDLTMTFRFFSSNSTSSPPLSMIIRDFATPPMWAILATFKFILAFAAMLRMSIHKLPTYGTWLSESSFFFPVNSTSFFFCLVLHMSFSLTLMASCSRWLDEFPATNAMFVSRDFPIKIFFTRCHHIDINTYKYNRQPRAEGRGGY